jgi:hypothetical protein
MPYIDATNHKVQISGKFTVDTTAPTIKPFTVDSDRKKYVNFTNGVNLIDLQGLVYINATVFDLPGKNATTKDLVAGVDKVYVRINDGEWKSMNLTNISNMYQMQWRTGKADNGPNVIEVKAVDKLGNAAIASQTIYIDNPDYTSGALAIAGICSFFVLFMGFFLFHWRKYKEIADTTPSGYDTMSQEQMMQYQQQNAASAGEIQW